mmetsp:Transcript_143745/g.400675  ORF Transcript_143745/g.400675 Transcript_143745/m.400675 type:complete len:301 (+) Transcript_143745:759-1661(+)
MEGGRGLLLRVQRVPGTGRGRQRARLHRGQRADLAGHGIGSRRPCFAVPVPSCFAFAPHAGPLCRSLRPLDLHVVCSETPQEGGTPCTSRYREDRRPRLRSPLRNFLAWLGRGRWHLHWRNGLLPRGAARVLGLAPQRPADAPNAADHHLSHFVHPGRNAAEQEQLDGASPVGFARCGPLRAAPWPAGVRPAVRGAIIPRSHGSAALHGREPHHGFFHSALGQVPDTRRSSLHHGEGVEKEEWQAAGQELQAEERRPQDVPPRDALLRAAWARGLPRRAELCGCSPLPCTGFAALAPFLY